MDQPIRQSLEACRPASQDLLSPEMAEAARAVQNDPQARLVRERIEQWDMAITGAIEEVAVPPGVDERILQRLQAASAAAQVPDLLSGTVAAATNGHHSTLEVQLAPPAQAEEKHLRRRWVAGIAAAAVVGGLVVGSAMWLRPERELALDELADQWAAQLGPDWQPMSKAPSEFAPPGAILLQPARWQWIDRITTAPVVAYELVHEKAGKAMLYVAKMTRDNVPGSPPRTPFTTAGKAIAYWKSGGHVYVLVVEQERSYQQFVKPATTPFA